MLLILGTANRKKALELVDLLAPWGFQCQTLAEVAGAIDVDETGTTFAENARLSNPLVFSIREDHEGTLWLGTLNGFSRIKDGHARGWNGTNGFRAGPVFDVMPGADDDLWLSTLEGVRLVRARACTGRHNGAADTPVFEAHLDLHGGVAP